MKGFFDDIVDLIKKNERVEELRQVARGNDFKFKNKESWASQDYLLKSFTIFKGKKDRRMKGVMWKDIIPLEAKIRIFDYIYFGEMKTRKTTIFEIECRSFDLPKFEIHPKGFFKKVSDIFVSKEKPYPDDSEFHGKYEIQTNDHNGFEEALNPHFLDFLLEKKNYSAEGEGDVLLLSANQKQTPATQLMVEYESVLDLMDDLLKKSSPKSDK